MLRVGKYIFGFVVPPNIIYLDVEGEKEKKARLSKHENHNIENKDSNKHLYKIKRQSMGGL